MALFHFTFNVKDDNKAILREISNLKSIIMATKAEFQQALTDITSGLDNIAADITRLTDQLQTGNLSDTEEQEIFNQLRATADRVKQIADQTPETETPSPDTE